MSLVSTIIEGDCREVLKGIEPESVQTCITSPPYFGLRDYGHGDQIGLEGTPQGFVDELVKVFEEVKRTLKDSGTLWLNLGDSYVSKATGSLGNSTGEKWGFKKDHKHQGAATDRPDKTGFGLAEKNLIGIPWRVAFALQENGWFLRQDIIWHKPNPMPESVTDRCTKAHEYIFLLSKSQKYFYNADAIKERQSTVSIARAKRGVSDNNKWTDGAGGQTPHSMSQGRSNDKSREVSEMRNKRSVWTVTTKPFKDAHFATFPAKLIEPCVLAGSRRGDTVLDPFSGAGTTGLVAVENNRNYLGIELNPEYKDIADRRISSAQPYLTL